MSTRDEDRPHFSEQDAVRLAEDLFGVCGSVEELPSERDRNFYLRTASGEEYVLKIAATSEPREILEFQNAAIENLQKQGSPVKYPQVQKSKTGEFISTITDEDGRPHFIRLLSYLPGNVFAHVNPHTHDLLYDLGRFVGFLSQDLAGFSHPATKRDLYWDLQNAHTVIAQHKKHIDDPAKVAIIDYCLKTFETKVLPALSQLRTSVIHNDVNDYNIIIDNAYSAEDRSFGIIDFGDMVASHTVFELAVATAYAMMDKEDPVAAAAHVINGYHSIFPLNELEIDLLFPLICTRLALSVSICAYQKKLEPENEYLQISEKPAWALLIRLKDIHPRLATYIFRDACKLPPCSSNQKVVNWLKTNTKNLGSIIEYNLQQTPVTVFNLSVGSPEFGSTLYSTDAPKLSQVLAQQISAKHAQLGIGRYNEFRWIYLTEQSLTNIQPGEELSNIHLGIDLFLNQGAPIFAPLDGRIHSFQIQASQGAHGPTIILEHEVTKDVKFYTIYGNLSKASFRDLKIGASVKKGDQIATLGAVLINGDASAHLHFQLAIDLLDKQGGFPNMAPPSQRDVWLSLCPDPNLILQIPEKVFPKERMRRDDILRIRQEYSSPTLSIAYQTPLHIVRGFMQYLFDDTGKAYLDAVNNVPHVGHCHPHVVKTLQQQAGILNTNTRYLHENLVIYAQRLTATLPEPLRVCFFVNSGSEANELALRLAQAHTNQRDLIVIDGAYHGNTGNLIDISPYKFDGPGGRGVPPHVHKVLMPDQYRGKYRASDQEAGAKYAKEVHGIIKQIKNEGRGIAAFICEPLMGCGGQIVLPNNYLREAFQYVRRAGGICIVDEVQVGLGRVGIHFWGFQTQDVVPDIVTLAKPIGNGHPIAAVVTTPEIARSFETGMEFFSTTGGNSVSCAVGLAVLDVLEKEHLQENALQVGQYLMNQLNQLKEKYPLIGDVRGLGLFIGVELVKNPKTLEPAAEEAKYIIERLKDLGVLISIDGPLYNVLKIKPPMNFTKENANFLIQVLDKVLSEDYVNLSE